MERGDAFHAYIIDWRLPDMNGIEVTRQIRSLGDDTPIIIMTAYDWSAIEVEALSLIHILLKQRDYYIYAYRPDTEIFHNLPLSVLGVIFFYFLIFGLFLFWRYKANQAHQKQKLEEEEKYKAELLIAAKKAEAANRAKTEFLQRMSHDIRTPRCV